MKGSLVSVCSVEASLGGPINQTGGHPLGGKGSKLRDTSGIVDQFFNSPSGEFFCFKIYIDYCIIG